MFGHRVKYSRTQTFLNPASNPHQNAGAQELEKSVIRIECNNNADERHEGWNAARPQNPVIDLQHEQRSCEHQNVDNTTEGQGGQKSPTAGANNARYFAFGLFL
jgi:hypothetical protein